MLAGCHSAPAYNLLEAFCLCVLFPPLPDNVLSASLLGIHLSNHWEPSLENEPETVRVHYSKLLCLCASNRAWAQRKKNTNPTLFSHIHFGFSCHHSVHIWMDSSAILWSMTETSRSWESTSLHPTYQAAQNVWCSVVRQHNGQKRADNWSKGWMQNAAAGKQHLRKTQQNCSHTSTLVVVPNNHSASVVDRYTQEKIPSYIHIHIHRRNTHGCAHSQSLSDSAPFHSLPFFFFFLTKCCCTFFTKKWTLKITQQQPNTTPCCCLSEDKGNTHLIYKSWGKCCCVNWTASLHWWKMTVLAE